MALIESGTGRTALATLAAVLAVAVSACGSGDSTDPLPSLLPTVQPPTASNAPALDDVTLRNSLLDETVLTGYTALNDPPPGTVTGAGTATDPSQCAKVLSPVAEQAPGARAQAIAQFSGTDFASIDIDAASYANGGSAQAFSLVQSLLQGCAAYSGKDADNITVEFRLGGLEIPKAGDASTAFRVHTSSQGFTLYTAVSLTVVGSTVVQIAMSGASEPDPQKLGDITAEQVKQLRAATGS
ncbi:sensor domain-containing protein [Nocardia sp. 2]|uniref:Sensor domain-containing protein n=1 Tax=Nocardia acididurans TaxID=2802282 RepID=A0ABS1MB11_9NOCA|nr:sensor domain-containing protein [Nocardia acididurans]MBL1077823.1 sensor domain-containing protein [Nocardia acididurans]